MDDKPECAGNYAHAYYRNRQFTRVMLGMGVFNPAARYDDELTLREKVRDFYERHHDELYAAVDAAATVPHLEMSYAGACLEGLLAIKVAPRMAAIGMLSCGIVGDYGKMRTVHEAYRSAITTFGSEHQSTAHGILHETINDMTLHRSALYSDIPNDNEAKIQYSQTLRRCMAWSAMSDDMYVTRMKQANLRPVSRVARRLSNIFYCE